MILSFHDRTTEDIYNGTESKAARSIPSPIWKIATRKLDMLNAAHDMRDLKVPLGNRLETLKGAWKGYYSIRINNQFRIIFQWVEVNARDVMITDYH